MDKLIFDLNKDVDVVIEDISDDAVRKNSIYSGIYNQAIAAVKRHFARTDNFGKFSNVFVFTGDHGTGKSSCIESFKTSFTKGMYAPKCFLLDTISPSPFDAPHSIVELVVASIYRDYDDMRKSVNDEHKKLKMLKTITVVQKEICYMLGCRRCTTKMSSDGGYESTYEYNGECDDLSRLSMSAASMRLKDDIEIMVREFLDFIGFDKLVITIDDISGQESYRMIEHIRRYLNIKDVIILAAMNVPVKFNKQLCQAGIDDNKFSVMTSVINKFCPNYNTYSMPELKDIKERGCSVVIDGVTYEAEDMSIDKYIMQKADNIRVYKSMLCSVAMELHSEKTLSD